MEGLREKGFTLIELLVVISIISLLASMVISSTGKARVKAYNSARNSQAVEYAKALMLYKAEHGVFPLGSLTSKNQGYCLGIYSSPNECDFFSTVLAGNAINTDPDSKLQEALSPYLKSFPQVGGARRVEGSRKINETKYDGYYIGAVYTCGPWDEGDDSLNNACRDHGGITKGQKATIYWFLEGQDAVCARPQNVVVYSDEANHAPAVACRMVLE